MSDAGQITIFSLVVLALTLWVLYWVIRKAIVHGLREHERGEVTTEETEPATQTR